MSDDACAYTKAELEYIFRNKVSEELYQEILAMDPPLSSTIVEKQFTILFTDIRGLTRIEDENGLEFSSRLVVGILGAVLDEGKARTPGADLGVGFHSGTASIGCYSPRSVPSYTPMGWVVNFASKLEELSKLSGNRPAIAGKTRDFLEPEFRTVFVDSIPARPYADSGILEIFTVVGERSAMTAGDHAFWDCYDEGVGQLSQ